MNRLTSAPLRDFEAIRDAAGERDRSFGHAVYPPGCERLEGRVIFRAHPDSRGLTVLVDATIYNGPVEAVRAFFGEGYRHFATPEEAYAFCSGPLLQAFDASQTLEPRLPLVDSQALARALTAIAKGQDDALGRVAEVIAAELGRVQPARPASLALLGPSGSGINEVVATLPSALADQGVSGYELFAIDCGDIATEAQATSLLGVSPGFVGYRQSTPLIDAMRRSQPIVVLRDVERASPSLLSRQFVRLLESRRLLAPDGLMVECQGAIVVCTSSEDYDELDSRLCGVPRANRFAIDQACRAHLHDLGLPSQFVEVLSAFAVFDAVEEDPKSAAAERAILALGAEFGIRIVAIDDALSAAVADLAARGSLSTGTFRHAARELLARAFMEASQKSVPQPAILKAGPPPAVVPHEPEGL